MNVSPNCDGFRATVRELVILEDGLTAYIFPRSIRVLREEVGHMIGQERDAQDHDGA